MPGLGRLFYIGWPRKASLRKLGLREKHELPSYVDKSNPSWGNNKGKGPKAETTTGGREMSSEGGER